MNEEMTNEQKLVQGITFDEKPEIKREDITTEDGLVKGIEFDLNPDLDKKYLICYQYGDDEGNDEIEGHKIIRGRKNLYEFIKQMVETMNLDESFILSDTSVLEKRISVYDFMKLVVEAQGLYPEDDFNIDDYR